MIDLPLVLNDLLFHDLLSECLPDWTPYMESCYRLYSTQTTWYEAEKRCLNVNSKLVDIRNDNENNFLMNMLNNDSLLGAWIGLSDNLEEGVFRWRDGTYANFTRWGSTEPDGTLNENCVYLHNHWWLDSPCNAGGPFICEKRG